MAGLIRSIQKLSRAHLVSTSRRLTLSTTVSWTCCRPQALKCLTVGMFLLPVVMSERCWFAWVLMQLEVSPTYCFFSFYSGYYVNYISCSAGNMLAGWEGFTGICALDDRRKLSVMPAWRASPVSSAGTESRLITAVRWGCLVCACKVNFQILVILKAAAADWAFSGWRVWYGNVIT